MYKENTCKECGKKFKIKKSLHRLFCSKECNKKGRTGSKSANWKGGRSIDGHGYFRISVGANKRKREHRIVAEKMLGRKIKRSEHVHHIDGDKTNNLPKNLFICDNSKHQIAHKSMEPIVYELLKNKKVEFKKGKYYLKE